MNQHAPIEHEMPDGAHEPRPLEMSGKSVALEQLGELPLVAQAPESLLDDDTTPTALMFIRNNGGIPKVTGDPDAWDFSIDGEVEAPLTLTLGDLKKNFDTITRRILVECGGNGRSFFHPPVKGNRWTHGGAGCPEWTGVRLADVLKSVRFKPSAQFSGHYGADVSSSDPQQPALSRGVPIKKLLDDNNLLAWAINGEPLPAVHGYPLRLIIPGWPGSCSPKWLKRIWIRDRRHDGPGMTGISYKVPLDSAKVTPGEAIDASNLRDLESMPVRSIITAPADGATLPGSAKTVSLRGAAWAGDFAVASVALSLDRGATWQAAALQAPRNRYDWQRWSVELPVPARSFEAWVRATDENGVTQPLTPENWNPHGVGGNPVHRISILVGN